MKRTRLAAISLCLIIGFASFSEAMAEASLLALCPIPERRAAWEFFLRCFEYDGVTVEQKTSVDLPEDFRSYKLIALSASVKEYADEKDDLFEWVKKGGKLVCYSLDDRQVPTDFFPYSVTIADMAIPEMVFARKRLSLLKGLSGKTFRGLAGDVISDFDRRHWAVLANGTHQPKGAPSPQTFYVYLRAKYGKGEILLLQLHTPFGRNRKLMGPIVQNMIRWAGFKERRQRGTPYICAANWAATSPEWITFNWDQGVLMYGLALAYKATGDARYLQAVQDWADYHIKDDIDNAISGQKYSFDGYCGFWGPAAPVLLLYEATRDERYLRVGEKTCFYIRDKATRTPEGALGHYAGNMQIWVDTLFMTCPVQALYAHFTNETWPLDDAAKQLELTAKYARNKEGLFYHMWDSKKNEASSVIWGRGNGWVAMSFADLLEYLPRDHEAYSRIVAIYKKQVNALLKYQTSKGMWRTVIDRAETYEETSATAMITYGIAKSVRLGILPDEYDQVLQKAWKGLTEQVGKSGSVWGTSDGTGPADFEYYATRATGEFSWGTGAYLMAGSELKGLGIADIKLK